MSSYLTKRKALLGAASIYITSGLSNLILSSDALACHTYKSKVDGKVGCKFSKRDLKSKISRSAKSSSSTPQSSDSSSLEQQTSSSSSFSTQGSPYFGRFIGDDSVITTASNTMLTGSNLEDTQTEFFWAQKTGIVRGWRQQWRADPRKPMRYSNGDGGLYTIQITAADPITKKAKLPVICEYKGYNAVNKKGGTWTNLNFQTKGRLVAGQPYCFVWLNTHRDPSKNYVSMNIGLRSQNGQTPKGGWSPAKTLDNKNELLPFPTIVRYPPALTQSRIGQGKWQIRYDDGTWTGGAALGSVSSSATNAEPINHKTHLRHRFRPWTNHTVNGAWVFIQSRGNSGQLQVTLEQGPESSTSGNGTIIESASYNANNLFNIGRRQAYDPYAKNQPGFYFVPFKRRHSLKSGVIYSIRLSAAGGADLRQHTASRGTSIGWSKAHNNFDEQRANPGVWTGWQYSLGLQISTNRGKSWSYVGGNNRRTCPLLLACV